MSFLGRVLRLGRLRPRASVRMRLTVMFTALFVGAGALLLGLSYFLVNQREHRSGTTVQVICGLSRTSVSSAQNSNSSPQIQAPQGGLPTPVNCSKTVKTGTGVVYFGNAGFAAGTGLMGAASGISGTPTGALGGTPSGAPGGTPAGAFSGGPQKIGAEPVQVLNKLVADSQAHTLHSLLLESGLGLGVMALLSLGLGWWVAGRTLRPVHRITATARRLSERNLQERIRLDGPDDELKELADTFDAMMSRLESAFHSQRRFVANASHELRTPLATERVLIDEALANRNASHEELRNILEHLRLNNEDTERLIEALLVLARSERGLERREPVDLAGLTRQVVERTGTSEGVAKGVQLQTSLRSAATIGDPGLLHRLIGNLVENAVRHNLAGGWASVRTWQDGEWSNLEVSNGGPTLDPANLPKLVEPFRRGAFDRTATDEGFGLGLSIVEAIAAAHGAVLTLSAPDEGGLTVTVRLPSRRANGPEPGAVLASPVGHRS